MACGTDGLLGPSKMIIKPYNSDFISIKGSSILENISLNGIEIPYWQTLKSKVDLSTGESYTLSGIGDNHNFLLIRVYYDSRSTESEQFVNIYRNNISIGVIGQLYLETSNTTNRQKAITITNPSTKWTLQIEFLISTIDNKKNFFSSIPDPTETIGNNYFTDIKSLDPTQIGLYSNNILIAFIVINDIMNFFIDPNNDKNLVIDDISKGVITMNFIDSWNAKQAMSALAWLLFLPSSRTLPQPADTVSPVINYSNLVTYVSGQGYFATLSLSSSGSVSGLITIYDLIFLLIVSISDARDGIIQTEDNMLTLSDGLNNINAINSTSIYFLTINVNDIAGNNTSERVKLTINP